MEINVYDMLVFEDEDGNIYQDCVCCLAKQGQLYTNYPSVVCNDFCFGVKDKEEITGIESIKNYHFNYGHTYKLKEIWTRVDKDTYKKVWSEHLDVEGY